MVNNRWSSPDQRSEDDRVPASGHSASLRRLYVIGGAGSGKTVLAVYLSELLGIRHVELDLGGFAEVENLAKDEGPWVVEGAFVYGIEPLLQSAERIVWLDLSPRVALRRILWRHVRLSLAGRNRHRGLRNLVRFMAAQSGYYGAPARMATGPTDWAAISRAATAQLLEPVSDKVVRITSPRQLRAWRACVQAGPGSFPDW